MFAVFREGGTPATDGPTEFFFFFFNDDFMLLAEVFNVI